MGPVADKLGPMPPPGGAGAPVRKIVDRGLAVIEARNGNILQVLADELSHLLEVLADGVRRDLLIIADDEYMLAEVECCEGHGVALARFVDDHHIETRGARVKVLGYRG
jgi:hypothetical protein